jgi:hypothetical protein
MKKKQDYYIFKIFEFKSDGFVYLAVKSMLSRYHIKTADQTAQLFYCFNLKK